MHQLHVISLSEDGRHLVLSTSPDEDGDFRLALDKHLVAAVRGELPRDDSEGAPAPGPVTPRDIQARIRGGESAEEIAAAHALPLARVERYAGPVLAELERVIDRARVAHVVMARRGPSTLPLGETVDHRLAELAGLRPETVTWSARRTAAAEWIVQVRFQVGGRIRQAAWTYDPTARTLSAHDTASAELGYLDPAAAEEQPAILRDSHDAASVAAPDSESAWHKDISAATDDLADAHVGGAEALAADAPAADELPAGELAVEALPEEAFAEALTAEELTADVSEALTAEALTAEVSEVQVPDVPAVEAAVVPVAEVPAVAVSAVTASQVMDAPAAAALADPQTFASSGSADAMSADDPSHALAYAAAGDPGPAAEAVPADLVPPTVSADPPAGLTAAAALAALPPADHDAAGPTDETDLTMPAADPALASVQGLPGVVPPEDLLPTVALLATAVPVAEAASAAAEEAAPGTADEPADAPAGEATGEAATGEPAPPGQLPLRVVGAGRSARRTAPSRRSSSRATVPSWADVLLSTARQDEPDTS